MRFFFSFSLLKKQTRNDVDKMCWIKQTTVEELPDTIPPLPNPDVLFVTAQVVHARNTRIHCLPFHRLVVLAPV